MATSIVEIFLHGDWRPAGTLQALGDDRAVFSYSPEYVFGEKPEPVSLALPVTLEPPDEFFEGQLGLQRETRVPSFVYDLVPQGRGRRFLVDALGLADSDSLVMPLVEAGAFNPIGRLRLDTALAFYRDQAKLDPAATRTEGLSLEDIKQRTDEFLEHISLHSMLAAGTTGVQGVAPKFLLTTNRDGRWFADLALADADASEHWLVKLPRGKSDADRAVLRNEAAYLRLAAKAGLRTHIEPMLIGEMLFLRRFDRTVVNGRLHRLAQESVASVVGQRGFGVAHSQQVLLDGIRRVATDPLAETVEFMKRDVLNLAMRNTDNHARNTALQTTVDGRTQLTPLYDFAPMYLDPEVVPRSCHWRDAGGKRIDSWPAIVESLPVSDVERQAIACALFEFRKTVEKLPGLAKEVEVEPQVVAACERAIEAQAKDLELLRGLCVAPGLGEQAKPSVRRRKP